MDRCLAADPSLAAPPTACANMLSDIKDEFDDMGEVDGARLRWEDRGAGTENDEEDNENRKGDIPTS